jgi:two-component system cell cycle sensor histidine kinase/response regulator CckA
VKRLSSSNGVQRITEPVLMKNGFILFADDEKPILQVAKEFLAYQGYRVITASNGAEALERFAQYIDDIRLVVMDMNMPVMNGVSCLRVIQRLKPEIKIIAVSGLEENRDILKRENIQVLDFMLKPYCIEKLAEKIDAVTYENIR